MPFYENVYSRQLLIEYSVMASSRRVVLVPQSEPLVFFQTDW